MGLASVRLAGSRRTASTSVVAVLAASLITTAGHTATRRAPVEPAERGDVRPNIVLIVTDDQRRETLRRMPAVQRLLVDRGTRLSHAMVPTALCCPSRASILTGRFAHTTGVFSNGDIGGTRWGGWQRFYSTGAERRSVAVTLQDAGYRTGLVGKYLNRFGRSERVVGPGYVPPGWDVFAALMTVNEAGYFGYRLSDGSADDSLSPRYSTDELADRAVGFIRNTPDDRPLFLYFAPYAPHKPFLPAPRHLGALDGVLRPYVPATLRQPRRTLPRWLRDRRPVDQATVDSIRQRQLESLLAVDEAVEAIHSALRETGRVRDTLFVFTSDNGYLWGEHRITGKDVPYAAATRVPMVLRWDGRVPAGAVSRRLALNVDIAATLAHAAGVPMRTEGLSMLGERRRTGFVLEAMRGYRRRPAYCGWRTRHRMFVRWATGEEELYDYRRDAAERRNLAARPAWGGVRDAMRERATAACTPRPPGFRW